MTSPIDDLGWLMEEPYYLRPDEIAKLTDLQIVGLYGKERDSKTGAPKRVGVHDQRKYQSPEESKDLAIGMMMRLGNKTKAEAEAIWEKAQQKRGK